MCVRFVALFILTLTLCYLELTILRLLNDYVNAASIKWNAYEMCSKIKWTKFNSWNYFLPCSFCLFLIFILKYNKQSFSKYFIEIKKNWLWFLGCVYVCRCRGKIRIKQLNHKDIVNKNKRQENINMWTEDPVYEEFPVSWSFNATIRECDCISGKTNAAHRQYTHHTERSRRKRNTAENENKGIMYRKSRSNKPEQPMECPTIIILFNAYTYAEHDPCSRRIAEIK